MPSRAFSSPVGLYTLFFLTTAFESISSSALDCVPHFSSTSSVCNLDTSSRADLSRSTNFELRSSTSPSKPVEHVRVANGELTSDEAEEYTDFDNVMRRKRSYGRDIWDGTDYATRRKRAKVGYEEENSRKETYRS